MSRINFFQIITLNHRDRWPYPWPQKNFCCPTSGWKYNDISIFWRLFLNFSKCGPQTPPAIKQTFKNQVSIICSVFNPKTGWVTVEFFFSENFRFQLGLGFYSTGLGWVLVFIFRKTRFWVGFWVFPNFQKFYRKF